MNKYQTIIVLICLLFSNQLAFAKEINNPIDKKLSECCEKNYSTAGMVNCEQAARKEWDNEMIKYYKLLMGVVDQKGQAQLKQSQLAWLKYRDLEMVFRGHTIQNLPGTMHIIMASSAITDIVRQRALELKSHYDIIQKSRE